MPKLSPVATESVGPIWVPTWFFNVMSTRSGPPLGAAARAITVVLGPPMTPLVDAGAISAIEPSVAASHLKVMVLQVSFALQTGQVCATHSLFWQSSLLAQM